MKNKKTILFVVASIITIIAISIIIVNKNNNYVIPDNYIKKVENHQSHLDGSDIDYYIYSDKIIEQIVNYYPVGNPNGTYEKKIIIYDNLKISDNNINNYLEFINNNKGKTVLHIKK